MATCHKDCLGSIGKNNSILRKNVKRCRPTAKHRLNARVRVVLVTAVSFLMCPKKEEKRVKCVVFCDKTSHKRANRTRFSVLTLQVDHHRRNNALSGFYVSVMEVSRVFVVVVSMPDCTSVTSDDRERQYLSHVVTTRS